MIIVQLSDTHFGTEVPEVVEAVQEKISELRPEIVIVSGDITQRARPSQFDAAKTFLDGLPGTQKVVIPGNHDIPLYNVFARFVSPYANYTKFFGARENIWSNGKVIIAAYDATSPYRHTRGSLMESRQFADISKVRDGQPEDAVLVAVAHQPLVVAKPQDQDEVLINRNRTAEILADNKVDIILSGHVHYPLITTTVEAFPGLKRNFILSGAGTAVSHRIRPGAPNSFNAISVEVNEITVTRYDYDKNTGKFFAESSKSYVRSENGWSPAI